MALRTPELHYCTYYQMEAGQGTQQKFATKEQNDEFAKGLEFMGAKEIVKSYYSPAIREWYRYHNDKELDHIKRAARQANPSMDE